MTTTEIAQMCTQGTQVVDFVTLLIIIAVGILVIAIFKAVTGYEVSTATIVTILAMFLTGVVIIIFGKTLLINLLHGIGVM